MKVMFYPAEFQISAIKTCWTAKKWRSYEGWNTLSIQQVSAEPN